MPTATAISVNLFDGTRPPLAAGVEVLITILDGLQNRVFRDFHKGPALTVSGLQVFDNFGDNYTVLAWASGFLQAGYFPVKIKPGATTTVDLMLIPKDASYGFNAARWDTLVQTNPPYFNLLTAGAATPEGARDRYSSQMEHRPASLACFFNLVTAMKAIQLPVGTPLHYLREIIWDDTFQQDRFFAYADAKLLDQVRRAAQQGVFAPEVGAAIFHPGATASFKQVAFGEANVQLTFHEEDRKSIGGTDCVKVEPDMDYFRDLGAHALLEVIPNKFTGSLSDPRQVYVLRWIAGRRAGIPEFDPPYTLV